MKDWSHDHVLGALQGQPEPVGSLVHAFPGKRADPDDQWLEKWFTALTRKFARGRGPEAATISASAVGDTDISLLARPPVQETVRLLSIRPSHFRGFRAPAPAVSLDADLVVLEGRNSSGKTSISEAIEWILTGHLSRRESGQHGHPTELANCIANEFRPEGAETFVELVLLVGGERKTLRRVLRKDYSRIAAEGPLSDLFLDGKHLSSSDEFNLLNRLFAGVHPILMQHNLRQFVHDEPHARRQYFERLLQVDELTSLIEKAVVGPTHLRQIANPDGGTGLASLRALITELERSSKGSELAGSMAKLEKVKTQDLASQVEKGLLKVASNYFPREIEGAPSILQVRDRLLEAQRLERESRLPLLAILNSARGHELAEWVPIAGSLAELSAQVAKVGDLRTAVASLNLAEQEIARAAGLLADKGLLDLSSSTDQLCPLCDDGRLTLSPVRVAKLASWRPLASAASEAERALAELKARAVEHLASLRRSLAAAIPTLPVRGELDRQLKGASQQLVTLAGDAFTTGELLAAARATALEGLSVLDKALREERLDAAQVDNSALALGSALSLLPAALSQHREVVTALEEAVGSASRDDSGYRLRDRWLELAGLTTALVEDVAWESAKQTAKSTLDSIREGLIALRTKLIEHARTAFSDGMTAVWRLLRSDSGAQFSHIYVPEARGKGYKLEFELKALISDGTTNSEVDALRVFSESQVNVVGLAAYITRARSLGHRILIFDDPVQSMDEEHFRSFAGQLLPELLEEGFQVIILTHSDTFARRLNEAHYERDSYVTLESRSGKRHGCQIDEGNRRVAERLKRAERLASDGKLQEAWRLVRMALERLYTLACVRHMPSFEPENWANMAAEDMWSQGAGQVIESLVPGSGGRLKPILEMTAAGAHDKPASSETDVQNAVKYVKTLLGPLRVGAG